MVITNRKMIQQLPCPKCAARAGESCGHRKDKSRSHNERMLAAQKHFNKGARSMAEEYDNTDRGAAFAPFPTQSLILQGKLNDRGTDQKITLVKDQTRDGSTIIEVYEKVGVLFENDKKGNEAAPDYTGPFNQTRRLAAWRKMKDDKPYMTFNVSDKQQSRQTANEINLEPFEDDKIPF